MFPGMNPKKLQQAMKQMGINQEEIPAERVIIEGPTNFVINNPNITKITMQGNVSFQITGDLEEMENSEENVERDIATIVEKTNCSKEIAAIELEKCGGDIAQAIINLSE